MDFYGFLWIFTVYISKKHGRRVIIKISMFDIMSPPTESFMSFHAILSDLSVKTLS